MTCSNKLLACFLAGVASLSYFSRFAAAQTFPKSVSKPATSRPFPGTNTAVGAPASVPVSLEDRRKALNGLFSEIWEDGLRHDPEFASTIGDKRYDAQLTDRSVSAYND